MKPKPPAANDFARPHLGRTRSPETPLNEGVAESFREVEPPGFADHPGSSVEAAVVDPDVDDSEGGE
jgi:hypothetical protein